MSTPRTAETSPTSSEPKPFDIDKVLKTKPFNAFLEKFPLSESDEDRLLTDPDFAREKFAEFEKYQSAEGERKNVTKGLRDIYRKQIETETGIRLSDRDLECIDADIKTKNTDELLQISEQLDVFNGKKMYNEAGELVPGSHKQAIIDLENQVRKLADVGTLEAEIETHRGSRIDLAINLGEARDKKDKTGWLKGVPILSRAFAARGVKKLEQKLQAEGDKIAAKTEKLASAEALKKELEAQQARFGEMRQNFFRESAAMSTLVGIAKKKAHDKLALLTDDKAPTAKMLENFEEGKKLFERLRAAREGSDGTGTDYLEGYPDPTGTEAETEKFIDDTIEKETAGRIVEAIEKTKIGDTELDKLEKTLEKFTKAPKIGSKEGEDAKTFVCKALEAAVAAGIAEGTKRRLVKRIIIKLKA